MFEQAPGPAVQQKEGPAPGAAPAVEAEAPAGAAPATAAAGDDGARGGAGAAAVLSHWAEAPVQRKPDPQAPVALPGANVHTPATDTEKAGVVPLGFTGAHRDPATGGLVRQGGAQTVRVILDRFEELHSEFLVPGRVNVLGGPETIKVVPGDSLEIYTWNNNEASGLAAIGFVCDQPRALTGLHAEKASGAANSGVVIAPPETDGGAVFGMKIRPKTMGGVCFRAKVADLHNGQPYEISLTQACKGAGPTKGQVSHAADAANEDITTGRKAQIDELHRKHPGASAGDEAEIRKGEAKIREKNTRGFHEQGQFYGDLVASGVVSIGTEPHTVAAPGSSAYGAAGIDRKGKVGDRAAAYWVPITMALQPQPGIRRLRILPDEQAEVYPGEASVSLHAVAADGTVVADGVLMDKGHTLTVPGAPGEEAHKRKFGLEPTVPLDADKHPQRITLTMRFQGASATRITIQGLK